MTPEQEREIDRVFEQDGRVKGEFRRILKDVEARINDDKPMTQKQKSDMCLVYYLYSGRRLNIIEVMKEMARIIIEENSKK